MFEPNNTDQSNNVNYLQKLVSTTSNFSNSVCNIVPESNRDRNTRDANDHRKPSNNKRRYQDLNDHDRNHDNKRFKDDRHGHKNRHSNLGTSSSGDSKFKSSEEIKHPASNAPNGRYY